MEERNRIWILKQYAGHILFKRKRYIFWYCAETHEQRLQQACTRSRADRPARKSPGTPEIAYFRDSRDFSGDLSGRLPVQFISLVVMAVHVSQNASPHVCFVQIARARLWKFSFHGFPSILTAHLEAFCAPNVLSIWSMDVRHAGLVRRG